MSFALQASKYQGFLFKCYCSQYLCCTEYYEDTYRYNILKIGKDSFCLIENRDSVFETLCMCCFGFCFVGLEQEWKSRQKKRDKEKGNTEDLKGKFGCIDRKCLSG